MGQRRVSRYLCASQSTKKKEKSQEEERKENANQVPNQTKNPQSIGNKEKKKEYPGFFLKLESRDKEKDKG